MPNEARRALLDQSHGHHHEHPHGDSHEATPAGARRTARLPSPLWWSAPLRLACAGLLSLVLWLVIAWAVA